MDGVLFVLTISEDSDNSCGETSDDALQQKLRRR
jgi:hypothetical protein